MGFVFKTEEEKLAELYNEHMSGIIELCGTTETNKDDREGENLLSNSQG